MATLPTKNGDLINFCTVHATLWQATPAAFGLTAAQCTAFINAVNEAGVAMDAAMTANDSKIKAFGTQAQKIATLRRVASETINFIKAYAETQPNPAQIYINAQLPPPAAGTPAPPPAMPTDVKVGVRLIDGAVELKWKASNPSAVSGITYVIRRRLTSVGAMEYVGLAGKEKTFVDDTLPRGVDFVTYSITGTRSGESGEPLEVNVRFGTVGGPGGDSFGITSVEQVSGNGGPKKLAA